MAKTPRALAPGDALFQSRSAPSGGSQGPGSPFPPAAHHLPLLDGAGLWHPSSGTPPHPECGQRPLSFTSLPNATGSGRPCPATLPGLQLPACLPPCILPDHLTPALGHMPLGRLWAG